MAENAPPKKKGDQVVIALDGSEFSDYALDFYLEALHKPDNYVYLVHAQEYKTVTFPAVAIMSTDPTMSMLTSEIEAENQKTEELFTKLKLKADQHKDLQYELVRLRGEPGPTISHIADEKHATYLVVGCRGKGVVRKTLTGSVTDYIVHHSKIPVMVARHKDHLEKHHHHFHFNPFHHKHKHDKEHH